MKVTFIDATYGKTLEQAQSMKNEELKNKCEETILQGFTATNGHFYRTNRDDQTNMIGQKDELTSDPTIETVPWKTEDMGYVNHTKEEWLTVYQEAFTHKKTQLFKYDKLKKQVNDCTEIDQVKLINW